ncbi:MAG: lysophospholipid acyltransferase family protein [Acidiferrobacterales bacterium]
MTETSVRRPFVHPRYWPSWIGYVFLRATALLPLPVIWALGGAIGELFYLLHAERRHITQANLRLCFPDLDSRARNNIARRHFREFIRASLTVPIAWWGSVGRLNRLVRCRDCHYFEDACHAGRRIILLAPHFVSMEIGGIYMASRHPGFVNLYKRPKNPLLDYLISRRRQRFGGVLVERMEGLRPAIRSIKRGLAFYYLPDQDQGSRGAVFAPFFGVPAATLTSLGRLAAITGAVVIPCFTRQLPYGRGYEVIFRPPLDNYPSGDDIADASRMNQEIEAGVREMPEQYFWVHRRFKTRPPGFPQLY